MKRNLLWRCLPLVATMVFLASCGSVNRVSYLQNIQPDVVMAIQEAQNIKLQPGDEISIRVHGRDQEIVKMFNLSEQENTSNQDNPHDRYTVDENGMIDMPILGPISVVGQTRQSVANLVKYRLLSAKLVRDPTVTVEFANLCFSVLGEVNEPGRKSIERDQLTLLEAIADAGDLTIQGKRENVLVLRTENGMQTPYRVDLTNTESVYSSPVYYLKQNDIIYVEPTAVKINQSTQNGNTLRTPTFWFSAISTILTIILLVTK